MNENKKYIENLVKECESAFFSTLNLDGIPETRALANWFNQKDTNINALYFTTYAYSAKTEQIKKFNKSSIYYYSSKTMQSITLFGIVEIINDKKIKDSFWNDKLKNYYPKGKDDENYGLIKFTPKSFKYYKCCGDTAESKKIEEKI